MSDYARTIFRLIEYELWCNDRAIDALSTLSTEDCMRDFGFGWRTPHRTMFHIADVMRGWSRSVGPAITAPTWSEYSERTTLASIAKMLADAGQYWLAAARASQDAHVLADEDRLNHVLHLVTHGTHHRGQLLSMLSLMGHQQPFEGGDFGGWARTHELRGR